MELEQLKNIWKAHTSEAINQGEIDAQALRLMIHQRSQKALRLVNRAIWIELGLVLMLGLAVWGWFIMSQNSIIALELVPLWGFMIIAILFYLFKYRILNSAPLGNANLKENLSILSQRLGNFIKLYYAMGFVLLPLVGSIFFILGMNFGLEVQGGKIANISSIQWRILGVALVAYIAFIMIITRWYVDKIYGKHYQTLKSCLKELE